MSQTIHLAIALPDEATQHFERPVDGGPDSWRTTTYEDSAGSFSTNEPITAEWGVALDTLAGTGERAAK
ncbi:hypothetical protein AB0I84_08865 [Streptomyces spectabilis]|uniref:hypothetical protein n=1 Tax=Streptomyces spectabilis TaxID=68270 RepID=UPI0033DD2F66